jgi:hypothetical protein
MHWHSGIESVALYGLSAVIFINLMRFVAAWLAGMPGGIGGLGKSMGALVTYP